MKTWIGFIMLAVALFTGTAGAQTPLDLNRHLGQQLVVEVPGSSLAPTRSTLSQGPGVGIWDIPAVVPMAEGFTCAASTSDGARQSWYMVLSTTELAQSVGSCDVLPCYAMHNYADRARAQTRYYGNVGVMVVRTNASTTIMAYDFRSDGSSHALNASLVPRAQQTCSLYSCSAPIEPPLTDAQLLGWRWEPPLYSYNSSWFLPELQRYTEISTPSVSASFGQRYSCAWTSRQRRWNAVLGRFELPI